MKLSSAIIGLCSFILLSTVVFSAETKFKDMDDNHWAASSVYNCVRLGLTKGYPDGTFRGEQQINRYELMVFLSNLTIAMEKIMDQKLEEMVLVSQNSVYSQKTLEELRAEIQALKEQLAASGTNNDGNELTARFNMDMYAGQIVVSTADEHTYTERQFQGIYSLLLTKNIDANTGFEVRAGAPTDALVWTKRTFSEVFSLNFAASMGNGQIKLTDKKLIESYNNSLGLGLDIYGVKILGRYSGLGLKRVTVDIDEDLNFDEDHQVSRVDGELSYLIPVQIPYIGFLTLGSGIEQYYTEKTRVYNDYLKLTRYIGKSKMEITPEVSLKTLMVKEHLTYPNYNTDLERIHSTHQSQYYDSQLWVGDIFKTGTEWGVMYAYQNTGFKTTGMGETYPNTNFLGYASCGYWQDDWDDQNRVPSADVFIENGVRIRQDLYAREVFLTLANVKGSALPDKDQAGKENDDTEYSYIMNQATLDWYFTRYFRTYINYENRILDDSTIEDRKDQYSDKITVLGMALSF